jgi:hypothetical protein
LERGIVAMQTFSLVDVEDFYHYNSETVWAKHVLFEYRFKKKNDPITSKGCVEEIRGQ